MKASCECGRMLHPARLYPLYCPCGRKHDSEAVAIDNDCTHRGEQIGQAECDCHTQPPIYQCGLHGQPCVRSRAVTGPMLVTIGDAKPKAMRVRDCRGCPDWD